ncbi:MAG: ABC transporter substrate-binding protein [Rhodobiaceae bacterium]|nr:ABC transporter substrate-binding protein [Rhodobiaceae bacterium]MCC0018357.1 ABC transporter substrate-binding protein [Rhodobiaceae bacterium]MCC0051150.1 ABC transporter substrate-binding protein [Rhodobiaceae bacterium]MCC0060215.1 ABC transporter substrate-binding protein [Rhodobiaceae bacterium]
MFAAAIMVAAAFGVAEAKEWTKVRIGTEGAYPPFNYFDSNNELQGFDVDIAKALCAEMKVECEFVAQDWDGIIPALIANKYDAIIASMSITPERMEKVDFTAKYYSTPPALIAPKDSPLTATDPGSLEGKTIGAQSATTHATFLEDKYKGSTIKLYGTQDEANLDLASGRLDAVAADSVVLGEWLKTGDGACCKMVGAMENDPAYFGDGAGIAVRKGEDDLKEMLNKAIAAILENGTYKQINDKYFDFSVY